MANMMLIRIAIFGTMVLAVLFAFLSIAGNYWIKNSNGTHMGLWKYCYKGGCKDYPHIFKTGTFSLFNLELSIRSRTFYERTVYVSIKFIFAQYI